MATMYKLGNANEGIDKLAAKLKSIPKPPWQPYPAPPKSYKLLQGCDLPELAQAWSDSSIYCSTCFSLSRNLTAFSSRFVTNPAKEDYFIKWEVKLAELADSANDGCQFCGLMACEFFTGSHNAHVFVVGHVYNNPLACCGWGSGKAMERSGKLTEAIQRLRNFCEKRAEPEFTLIAQPQDWEESTKSFGKLKFLASSTNLDEAGIKEILCCRRDISIEVYGIEEGDCFRYRPVNPEPGSEGTLVQLKSWLRDCLETHDRCPKPRSCNMPERLVEILNEDQLALSCNVQGCQYAALSYCWGGPQTFSTTNPNVIEMQKGFPISRLPKTLQEAIMVARKLGFRYIWIDSLCILQDSPTDKELEIPKMPSYYKNASITICAGGSDCHQGFLGPRDRCDRHPDNPWQKDLLQMPYLSKAGETRPMLFRQNTPYCLSWEPISKRAWTFQERLLSSRMVIFGSRTIWQCNERFVSDGGIEDWDADPRTVNHRRIHKSINSASPCGAEQSHIETMMPSLMTTYNTWYQAIREYSRREMSLPEDKLPAISGLALKLSETLQDQYIAGLWLRDISRGLMWSTWPFLQTKRPAVWRAPSWSWASIDNAVSYRFLNYIPADAQDVAEVVECTATPAVPHSLYGRVTNTTLRIRAPLLHVNAKDVLAQTLRSQHMMPPPSHSLTWDPEHMDMLMAADQSGGCESEWEAPEKMSILALFAHKTPTPKAAKAEPHSPDSDLNGRSEQGTKKKVAEPEVTVQDSNDLSEESPEWTYYGLCVKKVGENQYERVASFIGWTLSGLSDIRTLKKEFYLV